MIATYPTPNLESQWLTPAKVAWVLDVSERTVDSMLAKRVIPFSKIGARIVRIDPRDLWGYLMKNRRAARTAQNGMAMGAMGLDEEGWTRVQRLIEATVEARVERMRNAECGVQNGETKPLEAA